MEKEGAGKFAGSESDWRYKLLLSMQGGVCGKKHWAQTSSAAEWAAWQRVNQGDETENDYFETVLIEPYPVPLKLHELIPEGPPESAERRDLPVFNLSEEVLKQGLNEAELLFCVFEEGALQGLASALRQEKEKGQNLVHEAPDPESVPPEIVWN